MSAELGLKNRGVEKAIRFSNAFIPLAYHLSIQVNLETWSYEAVERIRFTADDSVPPSTDIRLHMAASMELLGNIRGAIVLKRSPEEETIYLRLDREGDESSSVDSPNPEITLQFRHQIREELRGFYRVKYMHEGVECRMASTHFEPTSARLFFICQDEPAARADFALEVHLPADRPLSLRLTVLSNMPLECKKEENGWIKYQFGTITRCPPYLLACVVGELEALKSTATSRNLPVTVYSTPGKSSQAQFALEMSTYAVEFFEDLFQYPFPLPKLDIVAVPNFPIGGMENWGCISCYEGILVDERHSSCSSLGRAASLLCHEVSHNWFGNLVGIDWWEGLWLKEGMATWYGNYAAQRKNPKWDCMINAMGEVNAAKDDDQYESTHPVEVSIADPSDITQMFDSISYDKGMGLVMMLQSFLGNKWVPAVAHYIQLFSYQSTTSSKLWKTLEAFSHQPIQQVMHNFSTQPGFPLVHIERTESGKLTISQEPCYLAIKEGEEDSFTWAIPLLLKGVGAKVEALTLTTQAPVEVPLSEKDFPFVIANPENCGFYRVRYGKSLWNSLIENYTHLTPVERIALLSDTKALIFQGKDKEAISRFAELSRVIQREEKSASVLKDYAHTFMRIVSMVSETDKVRCSLCRSQLSKIFLPLAEKCISNEEEINNNAVESNHEYFIDIGLQLLIKYYSVEEIEGVKLAKWALERARKLVHENCIQVQPNILLCLALYNHADTQMAPANRQKALWDTLKRVSGSNELSRAVVHGLCFSPERILVEEVLHECVDNNLVKSEYGATVFSSAAANPSYPPGKLWMFFKSNISKINQQWGSGQFRIQRIVQCVSESLTGNEAADEFELFFTESKIKAAKLAIKRSAETIRLRGWLRRHWKEEELLLLF